MPKRFAQCHSSKPAGSLAGRWLVPLVLLMPAFFAFAQPHPMDAGVHYQKLDNPIATDAAEDVIEVLDVFWYGCPVCGEFEPMMSYWGSQVKGDLTMRRMPAVWNDLMRLHARVYYTALELGIAARAHEAAFRYLQEEKKPLGTPEQVRDFFASLGVSSGDFDTAWNAENVIQAVARAEQDTAAAGIYRVPALLVNGRYQVTRNHGVPTLPEVVIVANQLIRTIRDERRID